jgi:hypothetical protein
MNKTFRKLDISVYVLLGIVLVLAGIVFSHVPHKILSWDIFGYYLYLPFTFIYNDLGLKDFAVVQGILDKYQGSTWFYQAMPQPGGIWVMKYPMGMALLYAPWFFIGHLVAWLGGFEMDGFSVPYQLSVLYGSFVYTVIGLVFFRKSLLKFFDPIITSLLLILIVFGTNYLVLTVFHGQGLMSHNYLFVLFALILWFTIRWHEQPKLKFAAALGLLIGISALSRPTEILVAIVPLFWQVFDGPSLKRKILLVKKRGLDISLAILIVVLIGSMQLIYFKVVTGKFLYNSYGGNAGEGMEFFQPYILQVLFSFRKGWLVYTPLMALALLGFVTLYRNKKEIFWGVFLFFIIAFYVVASWSCWWYADSFSQRSLIPMYVFLALPLGTLIQSFFKRGLPSKIFILLLLLLLLMFNLFQSWQFIKGIIHSSRMTKAYYTEVFLKSRIPEGASGLLLIDRNLPPKQILAQREHSVSTLIVQHFDAEGQDASLFGIEGALGKVVRLDASAPFSPKFDIAFKDLEIKEYGLLHIKARVYIPAESENNPFSLTATMMHKGFAYYYKNVKPTAQELQLNQWNEIEMLYLTPEARKPEDVFRVTIWDSGGKPMFVDQVIIDLMKPKL